MLDVCLLGTGGMMPLPYRWLTSLMVRYGGNNYLVDCGEGTQIALREKGWSPKPIEAIFITHFHADHVSGLPGMLLTMGNAERFEPLKIYGPKGVGRVVNAMRTIAPELPFEIECIEITENEQTFSFGDLKVDAFRVNHNITCYGYRFRLERKGRFDVERATALGIEKKFWSVLQRGECVKCDGKKLTPDMVMGPARKGLQVTYCTDTRPTRCIEEYAMGSDLLILEGMYGEHDKLAKAKENKHMTMYEAAGIAAKAEAKELWLTHYSPSLNHPEEFSSEVKAIFPKTVISKDGRSVELRFAEEENDEKV